MTGLTRRAPGGEKYFCDGVDESPVYASLSHPQFTGAGGYPSATMWGLLYKGGILLSKDLEDMKFHIHKVQCVIQDPVKEEELLTELHVLQHDKRGSLLTVVARGTKQEILMSIEDKHPIFSEVLPLTLEEIFISETEVAGYDIKNLIL